MSPRTERILITSLVLALALSSLAVAKPVRLVVAEKHALVGTYGAGVLLKGGPEHKYVIDTTPDLLKAALFGFNIRSLARIRTPRVDPGGHLADEKVTVFRAVQGGITRLFTPKRRRIEAHLVRRGTTNKLDRLEVWVYTKNETHVINVGKVKRNTQVDITWIAKTKTNPGSVKVEKDGVEVLTLKLKNRGQWIGTVGFGGVDGPIQDFSRVYRLDAYRSLKVVP